MIKSALFKGSYLKQPSGYLEFMKARMMFKTSAWGINLLCIRRMTVNVKEKQVFLGYFGRRSIRLSN